MKVSWHLQHRLETDPVFTQSLLDQNGQAKEFSLTQVPQINPCADASL